MKTLTWDNAAGKKIEIKLTLGEKYVRSDITVGGAYVGCAYGEPEALKGHATCVAKLGKLGLNAERAAEVAAAIAAMTPAVDLVHAAEMDAFERSNYDLARKMSREA